MKHNIKITIIILLMFLSTQFIGLYVVNQYSDQQVVNGDIVNVNAKPLPYGLGMPDDTKELTILEKSISIFTSFLIAILVILFLTKIKAKFIMKAWFFFVTVLALALSFNAILPSGEYTSLIGIILAIPFAIGKIYKRYFIIHNVSEILIYPGIAAIFVPFLSIISIIILLIIISIYDMWAVWKSGIMQKMAKYQMDELKVFSGFYIPYISKNLRAKIKKMKKSKKDLSKSKIKVNVAILGGGDVVFPIITSGVILKIWGLIPAIFVIFGALLGLGGLLFLSEKKKFYPAMPFISAGIFLGMLIGWIMTL